ncbi:hypothetical protein CPB86DRAFT_720490, partial [Serendipita vermifera]
DARTGQAIGNPLQGHTHSVHSVTFSLDGHQVVSGSQDCTIRLWNVDKDEISPMLPGAQSHNSSTPPMGPYGSHFSVPGFDSCILSQEGWVKSSDRLLCWIPPPNRHQLQHPYLPILPTRSPLQVTAMDFSNFKCGLDWTKVQHSHE